MKIGLISDTHIPNAAKHLPAQVVEVFRDVSLIMHAGDIYSSYTLDELGKIAPVIAARGNGDLKIIGDPRVKDSHILEIEGKLIGLTHGIDYPEPVWITLEKQMMNEFKTYVNILIFGDTHVSLVDTYKNVLLINPGSPTLPNGLQKLGSVGLLEITKDKVIPEIVELASWGKPG